MAYPTTLALITALWSGPGRTKSIALWSGIGGGAISAWARSSSRRCSSASGGARSSCSRCRSPWSRSCGPRLRAEPRQRGDRSPWTTSAGSCRSCSSRRSSCRSTSPPFRGMLAARARRRSPSRPLAPSSPPAPRAEPALRPRRRGVGRSFWVAACAGVIVFGTLMGAMFVGQQFLQNVLGYSTFEAGLSILPAAALHGASRAPLGEARGRARARGSPCSSATSSACSASSPMLFLWKEDLSYWKVGLGSRSSASGSGSPARRRRTRSPAPSRSGGRHGLGTADLQRDLGGAIMQSILGALLTAGTRPRSRPHVAASPNADKITSGEQRRSSEVLRQRRGVGEQYPQYADAITAGAKSSFLDGDQWAYTAIVAFSSGRRSSSSLLEKGEEAVPRPVSHGGRRHASCGAGALRRSADDQPPVDHPEGDHA